MWWLPFAPPRLPHIFCIGLRILFPSSNRKSFNTFPSCFVWTSRGGPFPGGAAALSEERRPTPPRTWSTAVACQSALASSLSSPRRTQGGPRILYLEKRWTRERESEGQSGKFFVECGCPPPPLVTRALSRLGRRVSLAQEQHCGWGNHAQSAVLSKRRWPCTNGEYVSGQPKQSLQGYAKSIDV